MVAKKLPDLEKLKRDNPFAQPIPTLIRANPEVAVWLEKIFELKQSGELNMTHTSIAGELSLFLDREVTPRQIGNAYSEWLRKTRKN